MTKAGARILAAAQEALEWVRVNAAADAALAESNRLYREGRKADSRTMERKCLRLRLRAKQLAILHEAHV